MALRVNPDPLHVTHEPGMTRTSLVSRVVSPYSQLNCVTIELFFVRSGLSVAEFSPQFKSYVFGKTVLDRPVYSRAYTVPCPPLTSFLIQQTFLWFHFHCFQMGNRNVDFYRCGHWLVWLNVQRQVETSMESTYCSVSLRVSRPQRDMRQQLRGSQPQQERGHLFPVLVGVRQPLPSRFSTISPLCFSG